MLRPLTVTSTCASLRSDMWLISVSACTLTGSRALRHPTQAHSVRPFHFHAQRAPAIGYPGPRESLAPLLVYPILERLRSRGVVQSRPSCLCDDRLERRCIEGRGLDPVSDRKSESETLPRFILDSSPCASISTGEIRMS